MNTMNRCLHLPNGTPQTDFFGDARQHTPSCLLLPDDTKHAGWRALFSPAILRDCQRPRALLLGALVILANLVPEPAAAQDMVRQFPPAARRGTLEVTAPPNVLINGQADRLSPGARIKNTNNTLVLSGSLVGQRLLVNYLRETHGLIHEVWILNEAETQQKRAGSEPSTNFVFGSDADKPKVDDGKTPFDQLPKFPQQ
jgi:hypothetical protein